MLDISARNDPPSRAFQGPCLGAPGITASAVRTRQRRSLIRELDARTCRPPRSFLIKGLLPAVR